MLAKLISLLKEKDINWEILVTTTAVFVFSLIVFYKKLSNMTMPQPRENTASNQSEQNNNPTEEEKEIIIQISEHRHNFKIKKSLQIQAFINTQIRPIINGKNLNLIFQGRRLNSNKKFEFYWDRIQNNSYFLSQIVAENFNELHFNERDTSNNRNSFFNYDDNNISDKNSVSVYTIFFHLVILALTIWIIFCFNNMREIFTNQTIKLIKILLVIWALCFSNTVSKLVFYQKIAF